MKEKSETLNAIANIGAVAATPSDHDDVSERENEREVFIAACRSHEFHAIENLCYLNGRWHATAVKNNARYNVDYDVRSKSFVQGKQII